MIIIMIIMVVIIIINNVYIYLPIPHNLLRLSLGNLS